MESGEVEFAQVTMTILRAGRLDQQCKLVSEDGGRKQKKVSGQVGAFCR